MSAPTVHTILKNFHALPPAYQDALLKDLYKLSDETRLFMANRLAARLTSVL